MKYTVLLIPFASGDGYTADVVSLPGCITEGESEEEALTMAADAAKGWIETALATGQEVPVEPVGTLVRQIDMTVPDTGASDEESW